MVGLTLASFRAAFAWAELSPSSGKLCSFRPSGSMDSDELRARLTGRDEEAVLSEKVEGKADMMMDCLSVEDEEKRQDVMTKGVEG